MIGVMALPLRKGSQRYFQGNVLWTAEWPSLPQGYKIEVKKGRYISEPANAGVCSRGAFQERTESQQLVNSRGT